jgi:hypothetical protein
MTPSLEQLEKSLERGNVSLPELLAIRNQLRVPFKLHPLGFISCTLLAEGTRKLRLHYWPSVNCVQSSDCLIHDHVFDFKSWVLAGAVENVEYVDSPQGTEFAIYQTQYAGDQSILIKTGATKKLAEHQRFKYGPGSTYTVPAGAFHETVRVGDTFAFTALITNDVSSYPPQVFGPLTGQDRYVYQRELLPETVVEQILENGRIDEVVQTICSA